MPLWIPEMKPDIRVTEIEKNILAAIAGKGLRTYSDLYKRDKAGSRGAVQKALKRLLNKKLIEIKKSKKLPSGVEQKWYDLNMSGLVIALYAKRDLWEHIDEIAEKQKDKLPLVFGKWKFFAEKGVKSEVIEELYLFIFEKIFLAPPFMERALMELGSIREDVDAFFMEFLTEYVLFHGYNTHSLPDTYHEEEKEWVKVLMCDADLKSYLSKQLIELEKTYEKRLSIARSWKNLVETLEKGASQ